MTPIKITAIEIYNKLLNEFDIKNQIGSVEINLGGITAKYNGKDAIGDLLQEWISQWLINNNYYFRTRPNTQEFPDFLLKEDDKGGFLEIKTFNADASPAFDIANYNSYSQSLLIKPERLDADYLILAYRMNNCELSIDNIWLKKVWEISGTSGANPINLQTKYSQPYNLRPINFKTTKSKNKPFENKIKFLEAIAETHIKYEHHSASYSKDWFENVKNRYEENTGNSI
jgi:hypothetical protein